jgi:hypothetical protein
MSKAFLAQFYQLKGLEGVSHQLGLLEVLS